MLTGCKRLSSTSPPDRQADALDELEMAAAIFAAATSPAIAADVLRRIAAEMDTLTSDQN